VFSYVILMKAWDHFNKGVLSPFDKSSNNIFNILILIFRSDTYLIYEL
jgi:hypothetical protein